MVALEVEVRGTMSVQKYEPMREADFYIFQWTSDNYYLLMVLGVNAIT